MIRRVKGEYPMTEFFMKEKAVSIHDIYHIYDREGVEQYQIKSKMLSIHDHTSLLDMEGNELAQIYKKILSLHETHFIEIGGREVTEVRSRWNPIHQKIDAPGLGWQIQGNLLEHDFSVVDKQGDIRLTVHRQWLSIGDGYQVIIDRDEDVIPGLALMVALERIMTERRETASNNSAAARHSK